MRTITGADVVEAMHTIMLWTNDERAYDAWIYTMPDEPTREDFEGIAEDKEARAEVFRVFRALLDEYGDGGIAW